MSSDTPKDKCIKQTELNAQDYSPEMLADISTLCTMIVLISIHSIQSLKGRSPAKLPRLLAKGGRFTRGRDQDPWGSATEC